MKSPNIITLALITMMSLFMQSPAGGDYYQYRDDNGTISFTDNPGSIPLKYRNNIVIEGDEDDGTTEKVTRFKFIQNQILVPVRVSYRGVEQNATFLLDTGATTCTISPELARKLNIRSSDTDVGIAQGVGGSVHMVGHTELEYISVGPHRKRNIEVSVIPTGQNDGLLGMNFLHRLRYHINFDTQQIIWGN